MAFWAFRSKPKVGGELNGASGRKRLSKWTNEQSRRIQKVKVPLTKLPKSDAARKLLPELNKLRNVGGSYTATFWILFWGEVYYQIAVREFCSEYCAEKECDVHLELPF